MPYRIIDMTTYPRRNHFALFARMAYPYVGLTVNVDITGLKEATQARGLPFFLTVCYCVSKAANAVPEFRQRILNGQLIEFDRCRPSYTVALPDGTYCYCDVMAADSPEAFVAHARKAQEEAAQQASIAETPEEALDKLFISTLPWVSFTALVNPTPYPADSNPRITWGKAFLQDGRVLLPLSVQCHHALVDGLHIARFYEGVDAALADILRGDT